MGVRDDVYSTGKVSIAKGGSVKWTWSKKNRDPHNVSLTSGPKGVSLAHFHSPTATKAFTFKRKFSKAGTYRFHCTLHPTSMRMRVVVHR